MELSPTKKALLALKQMQGKLDALEQAKSEPIAIVGLGCRFPGADNLKEFWQLLYDGKDAVSDTSDRLTLQDELAPGYISHGGFVPHLKEFDASFFRIAPREAASLDPQQRLLLEVSWQSLENAAIPADKLEKSSTGVFIGASAIDYWHQLLSENEIDAYLTTGNTHSLASGRISHFFDFTGPSISIDTACSSSLVAVHLAIKSLRDRECNMALAGGVNRLISPKISLNFARAKMLSPDGRCKTFDETANGFVRSEGCGIVVLKRLSDAIANKDRIRAVLLGSATNQDGRTSSITTPSSLSQEAVINQALANSKVEARQVSYLETHGTGTSLGDAIEIEALSRVFKDNEELILGAVKTNIGHTESASGIASLIKTVLSLENELIPANLHLKQPNTKVYWQNLPFKLPQQAIAWKQTAPRIAGVSGFGFSGTNAHVVVREAIGLEKDVEIGRRGDKETGRQGDEEISLYLFTLSAKSKKALDRLASDYANYLQLYRDLLIEDICFTANVGRSHFNYRLAIVVSCVTELQTKLTQFISGKTPSQLWSGKANSNRELKLTLIGEEDKELKELIKSIVGSPLVTSDLADISWQIGERQIDNPQPNIIYSTVEPEVSNWQLLLVEIAQLYVSGGSINWEVLNKNSDGKKITLPTYPFQRKTYWIDKTK